ncbi:MAG: hypothetical protein LBR07_06080, partial [Puniceicoccales bacterium]|nr:hypothetical protein [Puniceicoccales bacterium]
MRSRVSSSIPVSGTGGRDVAAGHSVVHQRRASRRLLVAAGLAAVAAFTGSTGDIGGISGTGGGSTGGITTTTIGTGGGSITGTGTTTTGTTTTGGAKGCGFNGFPASLLAPRARAATLSYWCGSASPFDPDWFLAGNWSSSGVPNGADAVAWFNADPDYAGTSPSYAHNTLELTAPVVLDSIEFWNGSVSSLGDVHIGGSSALTFALGHATGSLASDGGVADVYLPGGTGIESGVFLHFDNAVQFDATSHGSTTFVVTNLSGAKGQIYFDGGIAGGSTVDVVFNVGTAGYISSSSDASVILHDVTARSMRKTGSGILDFSLSATEAVTLASPIVTGFEFSEGVVRFNAAAGNGIFASTTRINLAGTGAVFTGTSATRQFLLRDTDQRVNAFLDFDNGGAATGVGVSLQVNQTADGDSTPHMLEFAPASVQTVAVAGAHTLNVAGDGILQFSANVTYTDAGGASEFILTGGGTLEFKGVAQLFKTATVQSGTLLGSGAGSALAVPMERFFIGDPSHNGGGSVFGAGEIYLTGGNSTLRITGQGEARSVYDIEQNAHITLDSGAHFVVEGGAGAPGATVALRHGVLDLTGSADLDFRGKILVGATAVQNVPVWGVRFAGNIALISDTPGSNVATLNYPLVFFPATLASQTFTIEELAAGAVSAIPAGTLQVTGVFNTDPTPVMGMLVKANGGVTTFANTGGVNTGGRSDYGATGTAFATETLRITGGTATAPTGLTLRGGSFVLGAGTALEFDGANSQLIFDSAVNATLGATGDATLQFSQANQIVAPAVVVKSGYNTIATSNFAQGTATAPALGSGSAGVTIAAGSTLVLDLRTNRSQTNPDGAVQNTISIGKVNNGTAGSGGTLRIRGYNESSNLATRYKPAAGDDVVYIPSATGVTDFDNVWFYGYEKGATVVVSPNGLTGAYGLRPAAFLDSAYTNTGNVPWEAAEAWGDTWGDTTSQDLYNIPNAPGTIARIPQRQGLQLTAGEHVTLGKLYIGGTNDSPVSETVQGVPNGAPTLNFSAGLLLDSGSDTTPVYIYQNGHINNSTTGGVNILGGAVINGDITLKNNLVIQKVDPSIAAPVVHPDPGSTTTAHNALDSYVSPRSFIQINGAILEDVTNGAGVANSARSVTVDGAYVRFTADSASTYTGGTIITNGGVVTLWPYTTGAWADPVYNGAYSDGSSRFLGTGAVTINGTGTLAALNGGYPLGTSYYGPVVRFENTLHLSQNATFYTGGLFFAPPAVAGNQDANATVISGNVTFSLVSLARDNTRLNSGAVFTETFHFVSDKTQGLANTLTFTRADTSFGETYMRVYFDGDNRNYWGKVVIKNVNAAYDFDVLSGNIGTNHIAAFGDGSISPYSGTNSFVSAALATAGGYSNGIWTAAGGSGALNAAATGDYYSPGGTLTETLPHGGVYQWPFGRGGDLTMVQTEPQAQVAMWPNDPDSTANATDSGRGEEFHFISGTFTMDVSEWNVKNNNNLGSTSAVAVPVTVNGVTTNLTGRPDIVFRMDWASLFFDGTVIRTLIGGQTVENWLAANPTYSLKNNGVDFTIRAYADVRFNFNNSTSGAGYVKTDSRDGGNPVNQIVSQYLTFDLASSTVATISAQQGTDAANSLTFRRLQRSDGGTKTFDASINNIKFTEGIWLDSGVTIVQRGDNYDHKGSTFGANLLDSATLHGGANHPINIVGDIQLETPAFHLAGGSLVVKSAAAGDTNGTVNLTGFQYFIPEQSGGMLNVGTGGITFGDFALPSIASNYLGTGVYANASVSIVGAVTDGWGVPTATGEPDGTDYTDHITQFIRFVNNPASTADGGDDITPYLQYFIFAGYEPGQVTIYHSTDGYYYLLPDSTLVNEWGGQADRGNASTANVAWAVADNWTLNRTPGLNSAQGGTGDDMLTYLNGAGEWVSISTATFRDIDTELNNSVRKSIAFPVGQQVTLQTLRLLSNVEVQFGQNRNSASYTSSNIPGIVFRADNATADHPFGEATLEARNGRTVLMVPITFQSDTTVFAHMSAETLSLCFYNEWRGFGDVILTGSAVKYEGTDTTAATAAGNSRPYGEGFIDLLAGDHSAWTGDLIWDSPVDLLVNTEGANSVTAGGGIFYIGGKTPLNGRVIYPLYSRTTAPVNASNPWLENNRVVLNTPGGVVINAGIRLYGAHNNLDNTTATFINGPVVVNQTNSWGQDRTASRFIIDIDRNNVLGFLQPITGAGGFFIDAATGNGAVVFNAPSTFSGGLEIANVTDTDLFIGGGDRAGTASNPVNPLTGTTTNDTMQRLGALGTGVFLLHSNWQSVVIETAEWALFDNNFTPGSGNNASAATYNGHVDKITDWTVTDKTSPLYIAGAYLPNRLGLGTTTNLNNTTSNDPALNPDFVYYHSRRDSVATWRGTFFFDANSANTTRVNAYGYAVPTVGVSSLTGTWSAYNDGNDRNVFIFGKDHILTGSLAFRLPNKWMWFLGGESTFSGVGLASTDAWQNIYGDAFNYKYHAGASGTDATRLSLNLTDGVSEGVTSGITNIVLGASSTPNSVGGVLKGPLGTGGILINGGKLWLWSGDKNDIVLDNVFYWNANNGSAPLRFGGSIAEQPDITGDTTQSIAQRLILDAGHIAGTGDYTAEGAHIGGTGSYSTNTDLMFTLRRNDTGNAAAGASVFEIDAGATLQIASIVRDAPTTGASAQLQKTGAGVLELANYASTFTHGVNAQEGIVRGVMHEGASSITLGAAGVSTFFGAATAAFATGTGTNSIAGAAAVPVGWLNTSAATSTADGGTIEVHAGDSTAAKTVAIKGDIFMLNSRGTFAVTGTNVTTLIESGAVIRSTAPAVAWADTLVTDPLTTPKTVIYAPQNTADTAGTFKAAHIVAGVNPADPTTGEILLSAKINSADFKVLADTVVRANRDDILRDASIYLSGTTADPAVLTLTGTNGVPTHQVIALLGTTAPAGSTGVVGQLVLPTSAELTAGGYSANNPYIVFVDNFSVQRGTILEITNWANMSATGANSSGTGTGDAGGEAGYYIDPGDGSVSAWGTRTLVVTRNTDGTLKEGATVPGVKYFTWWGEQNSVTVTRTDAIKGITGNTTYNGVVYYEYVPDGSALYWHGRQDTNTADADAGKWTGDNWLTPVHQLAAANFPDSRGGRAIFDPEFYNKNNVATGAGAAGTAGGDWDITGWQGYGSPLNNETIYIGESGGGGTSATISPDMDDPAIPALIKKYTTINYIDFVEVPDNITFALDPTDAAADKTRGFLFRATTGTAIGEINKSGGTGSITFNLPIYLFDKDTNSEHPWNKEVDVNHYGTGNITFNGVISGTNGYILVHSEFDTDPAGTGYVAFNAANTFTYALHAIGTDLRLGDPEAAPSAAQLILDNTTLTFTDTTNSVRKSGQIIAARITLQGDATIGNAALPLAAGEDPAGAVVKLPNAIYLENVHKDENNDPVAVTRLTINEKTFILGDAGNTNSVVAQVGHAQTLVISGPGGVELGALVHNKAVVFATAAATVSSNLGTNYGDIVLDGYDYPLDDVTGLPVTSYANAVLTFTGDNSIHQTGTYSATNPDPAKLSLFTGTVRNKGAGGTINIAGDGANFHHIENDAGTAALNFTGGANMPNIIGDPANPATTGLANHATVNIRPGSVTDLAGKFDNTAAATLNLAASLLTTTAGSELANAGTINVPAGATPAATRYFNLTGAGTFNIAAGATFTLGDTNVTPALSGAANATLALVGNDPTIGTTGGAPAGSYAFPNLLAGAGTLDIHLATPLAQINFTNTLAAPFTGNARLSAGILPWNEGAVRALGGATLTVGDGTPATAAKFTDPATGTPDYRDGAYQNELRIATPAATALNAADKVATLVIDGGYITKDGATGDPVLFTNAVNITTNGGYVDASPLSYMIFTADPATPRTETIAVVISDTPVANINRLSSRSAAEIYWMDHFDADTTGGTAPTTAVGKVHYTGGVLARGTYNGAEHDGIFIQEKLEDIAVYRGQTLHLDSTNSVPTQHNDYTETPTGATLPTRVYLGVGISQENNPNDPGDATGGVTGNGSVTFSGDKRISLWSTDGAADALNPYRGTTTIAAGAIVDSGIIYAPDGVTITGARSANTFINSSNTVVDGALYLARPQQLNNLSGAATGDLVFHPDAGGFLTLHNTLLTGSGGYDPTNTAEWTTCFAPTWSTAPVAVVVHRVSNPTVYYGRIDPPYVVKTGDGV